MCESHTNKSQSNCSRGAQLKHSVKMQKILIDASQSLIPPSEMSGIRAKQNRTRVSFFPSKTGESKLFEQRDSSETAAISDHHSQKSLVRGKLRDLDKNGSYSLHSVSNQLVSRTRQNSRQVSLRRSIEEYSNSTFDQHQSTKQPQQLRRQYHTKSHSISAMMNVTSYAEEPNATMDDSIIGRQSKKRNSIMAGNSAETILMKQTEKKPLANEVKPPRSRFDARRLTQFDFFNERKQTSSLLTNFERR